VTNGHLLPEFGFSQGFDQYHLFAWASAQWVANEVSKTMQDLKAKTPYFAFMHFFDPHEPYLHHKWLNMPLPEGYTVDELPKLVKTKLIDISKNKKMRSDSQVLNALRILYGQEVRYTDLHLGQILKKIGVTDKDMVIVTSDHGEAFWEHRNLGHGYTVYNEEISIPLIIRLPDKKLAGTRVDTPVSLVDLLPTILGALELKPAGPVDGIDLVQALSTGSLPERKLFSDLNRPSGVKSALLDREWKYIQDFVKKDAELYRLSQDPAEAEDLRNEQKALAEDFKNQLKEHREIEPLLPAPKVKAKKLSERDLEKFREVGYLN
jgi:arylsulfatase A-like enzyme